VRSRFFSLSSSKKEERAGERRLLYSIGIPLSPAFSPLVPRGEREEKA